VMRTWPSSFHARAGAAAKQTAAIAAARRTGA